LAFISILFPRLKQANVIIDLAEGIADIPTKTYIKLVKHTTIEGYRYPKGWARDQKIYFTAVFSKAISKFAVYDSTALKKGVTIYHTMIAPSIFNDVNGD